MSVNAIPPEHAATEKVVTAFLEQLNGAGNPPVNSLSPDQARQVLTDAQKSVPVDLSGIEESEQTVTLSGQDVLLNIVRPAGKQNETLPVFMFFHGGGWILGDYFTHKRLVRDLVVLSGAAAVFVNYTPSPEAHYPVAINQAYQATQWVAENGQSLLLDGSRLAVVGNSVGGNMSVVVSLLAKRNGSPRISFQGLLWPVTNASFDNESYQRFPEGYFLTRDMMKWFWDAYTTDPGERAEITASPLGADKAELAGLPPTLIQVAEFDVLRDEGEQFAQKLDQAGVEVSCVRYNGMIHDWGLLNPLAKSPGTQAALRQMAGELKKYLKI
ncbi:MULTISPECIES: alpha/beta hydrolase [Erwinia]|uniref:alpha/beta hydrolase n=1 Tax=Erwinia TaxID=551 RepID=UPI000555353B|nr:MULTISPECIES: alpha/beta hydrolase [Erwinia]